MRELVALCGARGGPLREATLPLGDATQTPEEYVRQLSATTGLPHVMVRRNMEKIRAVLGTASA